MKLILTSFLFCLMMFSPLISSAQSWANDVGGIYNIPSEEYNPTYYGYGSDGDIIYNKIDLRSGRTMEIVRTTSLYNFLGEPVATALSSAIGWNHETEFRDGGIIASSIADIKVGNTTHTMVYAWSVNVQEGGRTSGWIKLSDLSPGDSIEGILNDNKDARMNILRAAGIDNASYDEYEIISAVLPDEAAEYYLDPDRDASYTAGKAKYYYTRDDYISGLKNIPETGKQRYGVAHNNFPLGAKFYKDMGVDRVDVNIYPASSSTAISHKLQLVWGYSITSAGEKIYSWINERTLEASITNDDDYNENVFTPDPNKLYYIDNPAHNLRLAATGESDDAYTTSTNTTGNDVTWQFVSNGNGSWHIQRAAGGSKSRLRSDASLNADMQSTGSYGTKTYFNFPASTTAGTYYVTLPDGPSDYKRLQIHRAGSVRMMPETNTGTWVSFVFTDASGSTNDIGCEVLHSDNFNTGYGVWNDGGGDAYRGDFSDITPFDDDCLRLRDNDTGSNITTDVLNLSSYDEVNIDFQYYAIGMEAGEDFFLEVSINGGSSYSTVKEWNSGVEFDNEKLYTESVSIASSKLVNSTVFRFRCDASANADQVYFDNIEIEACGSSSSSNLNLDDELEERELVADAEEAIAVKAFPNPTASKLFVDLSGYMGGEVDIYLMDFSGNIYMTEKLKNDHEQVVDLDLSAYQSGFYLLYVKGENRQAVSKKISLFKSN